MLHGLMQSTTIKRLFLFLTVTIILLMGLIILAVRQLNHANAELQQAQDARYPVCQPNPEPADFEITYKSG